MLPSVYNFLDYRQYFQEVFKARKKIIRSFSYRSFARLAGSSSPNLLQLISARKLNISASQLSTLSRSLSLDVNEENYLATIVAFDHAKTHQEKNNFFQRILITREYKSVRTLEKKHYDYFSYWYNPVVRELVTSSMYPDDPAWIVDRIIPKVPIGKVKHSIELLESLNLIYRDESTKKWHCADRTISTPSEVLSMAVVKYMEDVIQLGKEALERFGAEERDIRSLTIGLSESGIDELKKRMEAFWKEILAFADMQKNVEQVVQVNMQVFPMSKKGRKKE